MNGSQEKVQVKICGIPKCLANCKNKLVSTITSLYLHAVSCSSETCKNGGSCVETQDGYLCQCMAEFRGETCETSEHSDIQMSVMNGLENIWNYALSFCCNCLSAACVSGVCVNSGTCLEKENGISCSCPPQFYGSICQFSKSVLGVANEYMQQMSKALFCHVLIFLDCSDDPQSRNWTSPEGWNGGSPFYYNDFDYVYLCMDKNGAYLVEVELVWMRGHKFKVGHREITLWLSWVAQKCEWEGKCKTMWQTDVGWVKVKIVRLLFVSLQPHEETCITMIKNSPNIYVGPMFALLKNGQIKGITIAVWFLNRGGGGKIIDIFDHEFRFILNCKVIFRWVFLCIWALVQENHFWAIALCHTFLFSL